MDYIYVNSRGKKCIGEIEGIIITPSFQFTIKIKGKEVWCLMEHTLVDWCIHLVELKKTVDISNPRDVERNAESLNERIHEMNASRKIAYAIKIMYEKCKFRDVSW